MSALGTTAEVAGLPRTPGMTTATERAGLAGSAREAGGVRQRLRDYVTLTKPRIISLLLVTTFAPMVIAARGWPDAVDRALDDARRLPDGGRRERDQHVHRPRHRRADGADAAAADPQRPDVARRTCWASASPWARPPSRSSRSLVNVLSALLALAGLLYYVFVYTRWLKRSSPQNIVIGGAAGAFPPLVGWAAAPARSGPHRVLPLPDRLLLDARRTSGRWRW